jgi:hypothetical protein
MASLLCSLFREAGFDASPVLVSTWQNGLPDTTLPSPLPFNHVIVFSPESGDSSLWLDVTDKGCPFGQLPWYDQGLPVLIAQAGNPRIRKTPRTTPEENRIRTSWKVQLNDTGGGSIRGKTCFWGVHAALLRDELLMMSPDDQREWMTSYLARRCSGSDLDSLQMTGTDSCTDPLSLFYVFNTTDFAGIRNVQLVYQPWKAAKFELPDVFRSQDRLHPVRFRFAAREIFQCTVALPQDFSAANAFYSDSLTSRYGHAVWSWSDQNGSFYSERILDLPGDEVLPQEYKEFRMFLDTIRTHDLMEAIFIKQE